MAVYHIAEKASMDSSGR